MSLIHPPVDSKLTSPSFPNPFPPLVAFFRLPPHSADAAFIQSCVQQKLDVYARITDVLQGTVKPSSSFPFSSFLCFPRIDTPNVIVITQCCMQILYDLGPEGQAAVDAAKDFERRKCNHFKARPEAECMLAMAGLSLSLPSHRFPSY
jgi:hypothetical protein